MSLSNWLRLQNGSKAPLPWQIKSYIYAFVCLLSKDAAPWLRAAAKLIHVTSIAIISSMGVFEFIGTLSRIDDVGPATECLILCIISFEVALRTSHTVLNTKDFGRFLRTFYRSIYVDKLREPEAYAEIERDLLPIVIYSYMYLATLVSHLMNPLFGERRSLPYCMDIPFSIEPLAVYLASTMICIVEGAYVVLVILGEVNMLSIVMSHLNMRFRLLRRDLLQTEGHGLRQKFGRNCGHLYRCRLIAIVRRSSQLRAFAAQAQRLYSFRIYSLMSSSAVVICILCLQLIRLGVAWNSFRFITWMIAKIVELLFLGKVGSAIYETTNSLGAIYFDSNWQDVLLDTGDAQENVRIMKLVARAMQLEQKPFTLHGLGLINVKRETVLTILQCAGSYFTFLSSMH